MNCTSLFFFFKFAVTLFIPLIVSTISLAQENKYFFYSQQDIEKEKQEVQDSIGKYTYLPIYIIYQKDTIEVTQINDKDKPLRNNNDIQNIGYGITDYWELNVKSGKPIYIHLIYFRP